MRTIDAGAMSLFIPLVYLAGSAYALVADGGDRGRWRAAHVCAGLASALSALAVAAHLWARAASVPGAGALATGSAVAVDGVALTMLVLATTLGLAIVRFSRTYLEGEEGQPRYIAALMATLASVTTVAISNHLGLLAAGWMATSLCLHHLLTFYRTRPWALIAAHKKFLVSRLAELCVVGATVLVAREFHTLSISELATRVQANPWLPLPAHFAVMLIALAAILKSAQLPVHGWLTQVMEAPTPVSALLHAGVVNLGGFVLIRLAPLLSAAPAAQALLVLTGGVTAVAAAVVMTTRISAKVKLAWSTCAQMGFMLVECGLGFYDLALLHLVAHSVYKAHAFLTAAGTVAEVRRHASFAPPRKTSVVGWWGSAAAGAGIATMSAAAWAHLGQPPVHWVVAMCSGCALAPMLRALATGSVRHRARALLTALGVAQLAPAWHVALATAGIVPTGHASSLSPVWLLLCALATLAAQALVLGAPRAPGVSRLHQWCFAGFNLDEWLTRAAFRVWPLRLPTRDDAVGAPQDALAHSGGAL